MRDLNGEIPLIMRFRVKNRHFCRIFSCHSLRHTFATRLCESGTNIKVIQDAGDTQTVNHDEHLCRCDKRTEKNELKSFQRLYGKG